MRNVITESPVKLDTYQVMGRRLLIHIDEEVVSRTNEDGTSEVGYKYKTASVDKLANRSTIIEGVMQTRYPTFGSEIAALQGDPEKEAQHSMLKTLAKALADYWLNTTDKDFSYYPAKIVPSRVTMRQARLALAANDLLPDVENALASMAEPDQTNATIEWQYSQYVDREKPFVALLGGALGLSGDQLDGLFIQAAGL